MKLEPVRLRALELDDLERTWRWHNDPVLYETLGSPFRFVSRLAEEEWLRTRCAYGAADISLAICLTRTGEHIGNIYLRRIDWVARHAETHMFIGPRAQRGRGYGESALRQLIRYAFAMLGLQRLYLEVLADNVAAIRLYEKCGFEVEGRLRRHAFKNGRWCDMLVMGLCVESTPAVKAGVRESAAALSAGRRKTGS